MPGLAAALHGKIRFPTPAQAEAGKLAKEVYGDEYAAAKTSAEKRQFARKLLSKTGDIENDLPGRYVLLRLFGDIAIQAGDIETAFLAVEQIEHSFDVNGLDLKREAWPSRPARPHARRTPGSRGDGPRLLDQAATKDDFPMAAQVGPLARTSVRSPETRTSPGR